MKVIIVETPLSKLQKKHSEIHEQMRSFMRERNEKMVAKLKRESDIVMNQIFSIACRSQEEHDYGYEY